jgi:hypothetical protein
MTNQHPITPPQELRDKWLDEAPNTSVYDYLIDSAARWGSDQELDACCERLMLNGYGTVISRLRAARRPKPPSLKEQALEMLENAWEGGHINNNAAQTIRRALEQLDD